MVPRALGMFLELWNHPGHHRPRSGWGGGVIDALFWGRDTRAANPPHSVLLAFTQLARAALLHWILYLKPQPLFKHFGSGSTFWKSVLSNRSRIPAVLKKAFPKHLSFPLKTPTPPSSYSTSACKKKHLSQSKALQGHSWVWRAPARRQTGTRPRRGSDQERVEHKQHYSGV